MMQGDFSVMRRAMVRRAAVVSLLLGACNVPPPPRRTGGIDVPDASRVDAGARCGRGMTVFESDYQSTNVALIDLEGRVTSESFASSATPSVGLSAPLSGDVASPTERTEGDHVVFIDESVASRIIWADLATGSTEELSVAMGFWSDPRDYVEVSSTKAYVPRYLENPEPGKVPFDTGSDVLVLDPSTRTVTGSIDLHPALGGEYPAALPNAARLVVVGDRGYVLLGALENHDLTVPLFDSRLAVIDVTTDRVIDTLELPGLSGCAGLALSPSGTELSVLCSANPKTPAAGLAGSGIAVVDISSTPTVMKTFGADAFGKNPLSFYGDYASPDSLAFVTFGELDANDDPVAPDALVVLDLRTGAFETVLESDAVPFTLGGVACDSACAVCFAADAQRNGGVVHRFDVRDGRLENDQPIKVERRIGLPPRYLGKF
jgi:hypothetical protein